MNILFLSCFSARTGYMTPYSSPETSNITLTSFPSFEVLKIVIHFTLCPLDLRECASLREVGALCACAQLRHLQCLWVGQLYALHWSEGEGGGQTRGVAAAPIALLFEPAAWQRCIEACVGSGLFEVCIQVWSVC